MSDLCRHFSHSSESVLISVASTAGIRSDTELCNSNYRSAFKEGASRASLTTVRHSKKAQGFSDKEPAIVIIQQHRSSPRRMHHVWAHDPPPVHDDDWPTIRISIKGISRMVAMVERQFHKPPLISSTMEADCEAMRSAWNVSLEGNDGAVPPGPRP
jgi:hypothetical protein